MDTPFNRLFLVTALTLQSACGSPDAPATEMGHATTEQHVAGPVASPASPRSVVTGGGVRVSLDLPGGEIRAGDMAVTIRAEGVSAGLHPRSMDVMSPTMPMHGVVRIPLEEASPGTFTAIAPIPMGGRWALFINLDDDGAEGAEFQFDVLPANASQTAASGGTGRHAP